MALPDILTGLLRPAAYPHRCSDIRVVETHISWVLLTGDYAYKIKKPVRLPFVDFGSLERRHFFCQEELRCNRQFAPDLYLEVVPVFVGSDGMAAFVPMAGANPTPVEWAVRMRQFPPAQQLDSLFESGALTIDQIRDFGARLAGIHASLPRHVGAAAEVPVRVLAPVEENFATLAAQPVGPDLQALVRRVRNRTRSLADTLAQSFAARLADGYTRECHGDLHLGNLVLERGGITAFDCIEFDPNLRWIDTVSDLAFLFMDCLVRGRPDLGYAFLDGYLDIGGDYAGVSLLPFYAAYRALVRAKVAAIQVEQSHSACLPAGADREVAQTALDLRLRTHLQWAADWLERPPGRVVLMSGVSGSGKSYLAERLVSVLPAIRLRSDVARRHLREGCEERGPAAGDLASDAHVGTGRYAPERVLAVYRYLVERVADLVAQGEVVVVDATFISATSRQMFTDRARAAGWETVIVACDAPVAVLEERVRRRLAAQTDPSEADLAVLAEQLARREPFGPEEPVLEVDTSQPFDDRALHNLAGAILGHRSPRGR